MMQDEATASTDLIRWTFTLPTEAVEAVQTYLGDLGADVFVRDGANFHVSWEEPEVDLDPIVEAIWSIVGEPFEITQEEFHRLELHVLQQAEENSSTEGVGEFHPDVEPLDIREL